MTAPIHALAAAATPQSCSHRKKHAHSPLSHKTRSPPTAIPKATTPFSQAYSPLGGVASAPPEDMYLVPRVTLPPTDLFASIIHGDQSHNSDDDGSGSSSSSQTTSSDDDASDNDDSATPPATVRRKDNNNTSSSSLNTNTTNNPGVGGRHQDPEFVLIDNPPMFFMDGLNSDTDLNAFYETCKKAPPLFSVIRDTGAAATNTVSDRNDNSDCSGGCCCCHASPAGLGGGSNRGDGSSAGTSPYGGRINEQFPVSCGIEQEELQFQVRPGSFGSLAGDVTPLEDKLKEFEANYGQFSSFVESLHEKSDSKPS